MLNVMFQQYVYLWEYSFVTIKYYKEVYFKLFEVWSKALSWRWFHIWIFFWVDSRCIHIFFSLKFFFKVFFSSFNVVCNMQFQKKESRRAANRKRSLLKWRWFSLLPLSRPASSSSYDKSIRKWNLFHSNYPNSILSIHQNLSICHFYINVKY